MRRSQGLDPFVPRPAAALVHHCRHAPQSWVDASEILAISSRHTRRLRHKVERCGTTPEARENVSADGFDAAPVAKLKSSD
jgi:hypothetical protein